MTFDRFYPEAERIEMTFFPIVELPGFFCSRVEDTVNDGDEFGHFARTYIVLAQDKHPTRL